MVYFKIKNNRIHINDKFNMIQKIHVISQYKLGNLNGIFNLQDFNNKIPMPLIKINQSNLKIKNNSFKLNYLKLRKKSKTHAYI